jgi:hypothetical protein
MNSRETPESHADGLAAAVVEACGLKVAFHVAHALERSLYTREEISAWLDQERFVGGAARRARCDWRGSCGRETSCRVISPFGSWWVCTRHYVAAERLLGRLHWDTVRLRRVSEHGAQPPANGTQPAG